MFKYNIPEDCKHIKLDIGLSYGANQSSTWLDKENTLFVIGFEPNPDSVKNIKAGNIQLRHPGHAAGGKPLDKKHLDSGRMIIIETALSNVEEQKVMDFYVNSKDCGTSSLFSHDEKYLGPIEKIIKIPVISLKMFFDKFPWDRFEYIDYIKIDAQGSDLNILKGAGDYLKNKVVFVTAEPDGNQYYGANECNSNNITNYMLSQNFSKINHPNTKDPTFINNNYIHLINSIYIEQR
jgi:FkbM family methyltransferase